MRAPTTLDACVELALSSIDSGVQAQFALSPLEAMTVGMGLKVRAADHLTERDDGGSCDGMSFLDDGVILYAPTGNKRENFTLGHELGHWLVDRPEVEVIYDWLSRQPDPAVALETLCDRLAQRLLLPADVITSVVGTGPVEAEHVRALYDATMASLPVCAIALASRLPTLGAIVIADRGTDEVEYASVHPHPELGWPKVHPWPGRPVPPGHPLALLEDGRTVRRRSFWASPWGDRAQFYLDAFAGPRRVIGVLSDTDLWGAEVFHPEVEREYHDQPERTINCCGEIRKVRGYPCGKCHEPYCPRCGNCRCDRQAARETRCLGRCGLAVLPHRLNDDGICDDCA
jgi:hypothetical protein